jgi:hypothetical protein
MRYQVPSETPINVAALADGTRQMRIMFRAPMAAEGLRRFLSFRLSKMPSITFKSTNSVDSERAVISSGMASVHDTNFAGSGPHIHGSRLRRIKYQRRQSQRLLRQSVVMGALASFLFLVTASECRSIRYLRFASCVDQDPQVLSESIP